MPNYQKTINNTGETYEPFWENVIMLARVSNFKHLCAYIFARNMNFQDYMLKIYFLTLTNWSEMHLELYDSIKRFDLNFYSQFFCE